MPVIPIVEIEGVTGVVVALTTILDPITETIWVTGTIIIMNIQMNIEAIIIKTGMAELMIILSILMTEI